MNIQDFMSEEQKKAYSYAAALGDAGEKDLKAWQAACNALSEAESKAIAEYKGKVFYNRHGRPSGGVHPALKELAGYLAIHDCYAPA